MEVIYLNHTSRLENINNHVMAIGFFDGVHLGHQQLLHEASKIAASRGVLSSVFTFDIHPLQIIKGKPIECITPLSEKLNRIASHGIDQVFVMQFDKNIASLPPIDFIKQYIKDLKVIHAVVGFDFTFGFKAAGTVQLLQQETMNHSYDLTIIDKKTYLNQKIGSTEIKALVKSGEMEQIQYLLGNNYCIKTNRDDLILQKTLYTAQIEFHQQYTLPEKGNYRINLLINDITYAGELTMLGKRKIKIIYHAPLLLHGEELKIEFLEKLVSKKEIYV